MPSSNIDAADGTWLAALWPEPLRFTNALDIGGEDQPMESHQVVPRTVAAMRDWAYVRNNPNEADHTRALLLLYKRPHIFPNAPPGVLYPVGVRVQGIVERLNLKTTGSWIRARSGTAPQGALQHIVLGGGAESSTIFRQYKAAVNNVVAYIYRSLDQKQPPPRQDSDSLFVGRRVFTKVTSKNRKTPSALEEGDDPMNYCKAIDNEWRIISKVKTSMYIEDDYDPQDGTKVPCDAMSLAEGDFVDVVLGFDIVRKRGGHARDASIKVHLTIQHILLLKSSMDVALEAQPAVDIPIHEPSADF
ncbi:hypothetical protein DFH06DRAFT_1135620 [Mycena polygramma]|nr:hypothetical protein DFH06DRAFT_1135620 [Mycena polygramma]